jgi:hypothetical protein
MSALPSEMIFSACLGSMIRPMAMVAIPASSRMRSAKGTWYPGATGIAWSFTRPPLDASIQSQPSFLSSRAKTTVWAMSQPPSVQSVQETRTPRGLSSGHSARTAAKTSRGKRMRFASEPPYSSSRRLESGERNS